MLFQELNKLYKYLCHYKLELRFQRAIKPLIFPCSMRSCNITWFDDSDSHFQIELLWLWERKSRRATIINISYQLRLTNLWMPINFYCLPNIGSMSFEHVWHTFPICHFYSFLFMWFSSYFTIVTGESNMQRLSIWTYFYTRLVTTKTL